MGAKEVTLQCAKCRASIWVPLDFERAMWTTCTACGNRAILFPRKVDQVAYLVALEEQVFERAKTPETSLDRIYQMLVENPPCPHNVTDEILTTAKWTQENADKDESLTADEYLLAMMASERIIAGAQR
jgi:hypothetical protein